MTPEKQGKSLSKVDNTASAELNAIFSLIRANMPHYIEKYHVKSFEIFGSFINGKPRKKSDIDILVEFEKPIGWRFFTLELYLERLLGRKVDLVTMSGLKDQIKNQILNQLEVV